MSALDKQIGGGHYKDLAVQPMEYSMLNKLDACQHTAIKYITRFREKDGIKDLDKAIHCIEMLKDFYKTEGCEIDLAEFHEDFISATSEASHD